MPAQDITTSDPHAQLLSIQEKIAAQTGGQTPNMNPPPSQVPNPPPKADQPLAEKDKNLLGGATEGQVNPPPKADQPLAENVQNSKQDIRINPLEIIGNQGTTQTPNPTPTPSNNTTNPNAALELMKADIFKLLGMGQITEAEKKKNLDEMEETIWQDFVETDLPEMLPPEQKTRFLDLLKTAPSAEKIINFFGNPPAGGLPKDFEQKYLRKTLDFKAEIVKEQIETLLLANEGKDQKKVEILKQAKAAADQGYWKKAEELMSAYK